MPRPRPDVDVGAGRRRRCRSRSVGAARGHDRPARDTTALERTVTSCPATVRASTPRATPRSTRTRSARADEDARAGRVRVGEPGLDGGLLGAQAAAVGAVAAAHALVAAEHVFAASSPRASRAGQAPVNEFLAAGATIVVEVDPEPLAHDVEALRERLGCECRDAVARPLLAHLVGRTERRRVVHDRASAETRAGEDPTDWSRVAADAWPR